MDVQALLKYFLKRKWIILLVTALSIIVAVLLVIDLPPEYRSTAQISTGLTDPSLQTSSENSLDYFRVSSQFGNIIEMMRSRRMVSVITNKLILHDLENEQTSFTPWSDVVQGLTRNQIEQALQAFEEKLERKEPATVLDNGVVPLYDIVNSMGYDESVLRKLTIERSGESDFINVSYLSTNPELSSFVVNTMATDFINYYSDITSANQIRSLEMLDSVMREKQLVMNQKNNELRNYKVSSGVLNLNTQSDVIYNQISAVESKRAQTISQIQSFEGALADVDRRLADSEARRGSTVSENIELVNIDNQLKIANQRYIDNNFREADKRIVDSLTRVRAAMVNSSSDNYVVNPTLLRQNLMDQKAKLETDLALAKSSMASIEAELSVLRGRLNVMVPTDAGVQNLERDAEVATREYLEALNRYNQANVENSARVRLRITEVGMPGAPEPSKKILYVGLSGFAGFSLCLSFLTIMFMTDRRIKDSAALAQATKQEVIGNLNLITEDNKDLRDIWQDDDTRVNYSVYKDLLRSLRFEIDKRITAQHFKVLGVTSLNQGDGKTFIAGSLAYAFAMTGKRILLIKDDASNLLNVISNKEESQADQNFESFLVKKEIKVEDLITVLNRNPKNNSLMELNNSNSLTAGFSYLKDKFDLIIIDINNLKDINQAKEWLAFTECSIAVFEAGRSITDADKGALDIIRRESGFLGWVLNKVPV